MASQSSGIGSKRPAPTDIPVADVSGIPVAEVSESSKRQKSGDSFSAVSSSFPHPVAPSSISSSTGPTPPTPKNKSKAPRKDWSKSLSDIKNMVLQTQPAWMHTLKECLKNPIYYQGIHATGCKKLDYANHRMLISYMASISYFIDKLKEKGFLILNTDSKQWVPDSIHDKNLEAMSDCVYESLYEYLKKQKRIKGSSTLQEEYEVFCEYIQSYTSSLKTPERQRKGVIHTEHQEKKYKKAESLLDIELTRKGKQEDLDKVFKDQTVFLNSIEKFSLSMKENPTTNHRIKSSLVMMKEFYQELKGASHQSLQVKAKGDRKDSEKAIIAFIGKYEEEEQDKHMRNLFIAFRHVADCIKSTSLPETSPQIA